MYNCKVYMEGLQGLMKLESGALAWSCLKVPGQGFFLHVVCVCQLSGYCPRGLRNPWIA